MLYNLKFNSKTQLVNSLMKLKGIIPKREHFIEKVDVNITSEGIYLVTTDGFRICSINFGKVENFEKEKEMYSDKEKYFALSKHLFEDAIKFIKSLNKVDKVSLKGGNIVGIKVTGVKNNEPIEQWFTEQGVNRLPDDIYEYITYPKELERRFSNVTGMAKTKITDKLIKGIRQSKKDYKDKKVVTLKLGGNTLSVNTFGTDQKFDLDADNGTCGLVALNRKFLLHALRNIKNATIEFFGKEKMIRILSDNIEQVIMPIRLNC